MLDHALNERIEEKIKKITYFSEETLIIDCFGTIEFLDGHPRVKYLYQHQYLIIRNNEILNSNLANKVSQFIKFMEANLLTITDDIAYHFQRVLLTDEPYLNSFQENKLHYIKSILSELLNIPPNSKEIHEIALAYTKNGFEDANFVKMLRLIILEKMYHGLTDLLNKITTISFLLKEKLGENHVDAEKKLFFRAEITRVLSVSETRNILTKALEIEKLKIYISSDQTNFKRLTMTYIHENDSLYGRAVSEHDVIHLFLNPYRNRFPFLTVLGGLTYDDIAFPTDAKSSEQLVDLERARHLRTPLVAAITEETFDYMRAKTLDNNENSNTILEKFGRELLAIIETVNEQIKIADAIIKRTILTAKQKKTWKKMKKTAAFIRAQSQVEARQFIGPIAKGISIGDQIAILTINLGISINFTVKQILAESQDAKRQIALLEAPPVALELSDIEIASLFLTMGRAIISEIDITLKSYLPEAFNKEMAGKLMRYYVFFPGYLKNMHSSLNKLHMQILNRIANFKPIVLAPEQIICTGNECTSNSKMSPLADSSSQIAFQLRFTEQDTMLALDNLPSVMTNRNGIDYASALVTQSVSQKQNSLPYDFGYWDPEIYTDPNTDLPKFVYYVVKNERIVGSAAFLSQPIPCRLKDGHNIREACGILEDIVAEIDPSQIEEVCLIQPHSFMQKIFNNSLNSIEVGASRGVCNVVYESLIQAKFSANLAYFISEISFYTMYFYISLQKHKNLMDDSSAIYQASIDTITGFLLGQTLHVVSKMGHWAIENGYTWGGRLLMFVGNFGLLAYQSMSDGLMTAINTTAGILSQVVTEQIGKTTVNFLKERIHALAPITVWPLKQNDDADSQEVNSYFSMKLN
jgi:hypothetical protein